MVDVWNRLGTGFYESGDRLAMSNNKDCADYRVAACGFWRPEGSEKKWQKMGSPRCSGGGTREDLYEVHERTPEQMVAEDNAQKVTDQMMAARAAGSATMLARSMRRSMNGQAWVMTTIQRILEGNDDGSQDQTKARTLLCHCCLRMPLNPKLVPVSPNQNYSNKKTVPGKAPHPQRRFQVPVLRNSSQSGSPYMNPHFTSSKTWAEVQAGSKGEDDNVIKEYDLENFAQKRPSRMRGSSRSNDVRTSLHSVSEDPNPSAPTAASLSPSSPSPKSHRTSSFSRAIRLTGSMSPRDSATNGEAIHRSQSEGANTHTGNTQAGNTHAGNTQAGNTQAGNTQAGALSPIHAQEPDPGLSLLAIRRVPPSRYAIDLAMEAMARQVVAPVEQPEPEPEAFNVLDILPGPGIDARRSQSSTNTILPQPPRTYGPGGPQAPSARAMRQMTSLRSVASKGGGRPMLPPASPSSSDDEDVEGLSAYRAIEERFSPLGLAAARSGPPKQADETKSMGMGTLTANESYKTHTGKMKVRERAVWQANDGSWRLQ
eukprot:gene32439-18272_t